jgi:hypothetical protein
MRRLAAVLSLLIATTLCACGNEGSSAPSSGPANSGACALLPPATDPNFLVHMTAFMNNFCYQKQNWHTMRKFGPATGFIPS